MDGGRSSSSSSEDDGDAEWRASINSVANTTTFKGSTANGNGVVSTSNGTSINFTSHEDEPHRNDPQKLKHYQIKAIKLLDNILEKEIEIVKDHTPVTHTNDMDNEGGVRLFRNAPRGIVFDHVVELEGPRKRPVLIPGTEIDEKSKKFRRQIQSVAVEGTDVINSSKNSYEKTLARIEAKNAKAKAAAKIEEERIAQLKKIRGERWLPSIAKDMKGSSC
jgi:hypothetical protein